MKRILAVAALVVYAALTFAQSATPTAKTPDCSRAGFNQRSGHHLAAVSVANARRAIQ